MIKNCIAKLKPNFRKASNFQMMFLISKITASLSFTFKKIFHQPATFFF